MNFPKCPTKPLNPLPGQHAVNRFVKFEHAFFHRSLVILYLLCSYLFFLCAHLVRLGAGQTARQWSTVGGKSGGERWAAVCQNGLKVTGQLLRVAT